MYKATFTFTSGIPKLQREEFDRAGGPGGERLGGALGEGGFASFDEHCQHGTPGQTGGALTSFFRGADHFDFLKTKIAPALRRRPEARLWCAGASTGEAPYSIVFTLLEAAGMAAASRIHVVATDDSARALEVAHRGVYAKDRFAGVPQAVRRRYLMRGHKGAEGYYKVKPEVRRCVEFRRLNLDGKIWHSGRFPMIFCRDALFDFNGERRGAVVDQLIEWLEPGGYLFIGGSESLGGKSRALEYVQRGIYRKPPEPARGSGRGGECR